MPEFEYKARDSHGASHAGTITAATRSSATSQLRERGWIVLSLDAALPVAPGKFRLDDYIQLPPRSVQVEISLQELAMMTRSGMTLLAAINGIIEQSPSRSLQRVWEKVSEQVQSGRGLSEAMGDHRCFPEFVLRLVEVGEQTGRLEAVLTRAARTMRDRRTAGEAFASATIYPVLIVLLAIAVAGYMVVYLIPRLEEYLRSLGREIPAMTQALVDVSLWLQTNFAILLVGLVALLSGLIIAISSRDGRLILDRWLLHVPLIGQLIRLSETSTLARGLSMMLKSGITLTEGLGAVEKVLSNRFLRQTIVRAREKIIRGHNLVDALQERGAFSPMLHRMAAVGEQTGELHSALDELADFLDTQFRAKVQRLNAILTPLITVVIGGIVGYVYIAFFMALVAAHS